MQYRIKLSDDRQDAVCKFFSTEMRAMINIQKKTSQTSEKKIFRKSVILKFNCFEKI
jgi:hypothetical protein